jgi:hypothetical protein
MDEESKTDFGSCVTVDGSNTLSVGVNVNYDFISYANECDNSDSDTGMTVRGSLVVEDENGEQIDVSEFIKTVKERLAILQPRPEDLEKYEALRDSTQA